MNRGGRGIAQAMMIAVALMTIFPLYFIVITAFKTRAGVPDEPVPAAVATRRS